MVCASPTSTPSPKAGDIIGWSSFEPTSMAINVATLGIPGLHPNHLSILAKHDGQLRNFEVTTRKGLDCLIAKREVCGAQCVDLADRIKDYPGHVWLYPIYRNLYPHESQELTKFLVARIGTPYDTLEAIESGGWFQLLAILASAYREMFGIRVESAFCSDQDAAAISAIGIKAIRDPAKWNPNRLIRHLRWHQKILHRVRLK